MSTPPLPTAAPAPSKTMSSRLLTMKFMQRASASASSQNPPPSAPPSKRQKLTTASTSYHQNQNPALPPPSPSALLPNLHSTISTSTSGHTHTQPSSAAVPTAATDATVSTSTSHITVPPNAETQWVLSCVFQEDGNGLGLDEGLNGHREEGGLQESKEEGARIIRKVEAMGYSGIDNNNYSSSRETGRMSFGNFNSKKRIEKRQRDDSPSSNASASDSNDSNSSVSDNSEDQAPTTSPIPTSRVSTTTRKSDLLPKAVSSISEPRRKEANLKRLNSISLNGGGKLAKVFEKEKDKARKKRIGVRRGRGRMAMGGNRLDKS